MEIIYEIRGSALVAALFGEMDHHGAEKLRQAIDGMMETYGKKNLIFDFSNVTFMDSAGISVVLGRYRKLEPAGGTVLIASCSQRIRSILNLAGIFSLMEYMDTKEEAVA